MHVKDRMKVLITIALLPVLMYLLVEGAASNDGTQIGASLAIISMLGLFWGPPGARGGDSP